MIFIGNQYKSYHIDNIIINKTEIYYMIREELVIGKQVWMRYNLNVDKFQNGGLIQQAVSFKEWKIAGDNKQPAYCYYNYEHANGDKYGKLYNWFAVNDPRGLSPLGWHIPSLSEWKELVKHTGGYNNVSSLIRNDNISFANEHENCFSALPAGFCSDSGRFLGLGSSANWWSSSEFIISLATHIKLDFNNKSISVNHLPKEVGFSVRCLKD